MNQMEERHIQMIERIHNALVGDDYNEEGIIRKVNRIEKKVDKHDMIIGVVIGVFTVVCAVLAFGKDLIALVS